MSAKEDNRIFVGGLSWDTTERRLETEFNRFGKVIEAQVMLERDTGRPRGFGFVTFSDPRAVEAAISEMHEHELDGRVISVNKAQPKMSTDDSSYGGYNSSGYASGGRGGYRGSDGPPPAGRSDECFKCGRLGHWARECPSAGGGGGGHFPSRSKFGGGGGRGDRGGPDRYNDRYLDDRYDGGRYGDRDRIDSRESRYGGGRDRFDNDRDRYANDRYVPAGDRFSGDRYAGRVDRYPQNGYSRERSYERDVPRGGAGAGAGAGAGYDRDGGPRGGGYDRDAPRGGGSDRYGSGGPARYDGGSYRDRPAPYDRPSRAGRPSSYDVRY